MKKVITLLSVVVLLTSCSTQYQTTNYNSEKSYTFKRGGVRYKITDTYTRKVETDTLTIKKK
jgi:outer membrane biogenesis lipoprotein LolB